MNKIPPDKAQTALLPPFSGLALANIFVPASEAEFTAAAAEIMAAQVVGFDTESKPTFFKDQQSQGPHVVQFALHDKAFIFQLHHRHGWPFLLELLQAESLLKVGFGLGQDKGQIYEKLGVRLQSVLDLCSVFRQMGYRNSVGVRSAVAIVFEQKFQKSRRVTTSNWANHALTPSQLLYAANDAYAALRVQAALALPKLS